MSAAKGLVTQGKIGLCTRSIKYQKTPPQPFSPHMAPIPVSSKGNLKFF